LKDVAIVMHLHELAPVGRQARSGRHRRRLERFADMPDGEGADGGPETKAASASAAPPKSRAAFGGSRSRFSNGTLQ
jgi:hypothetical protein